jgi:hypothetical protein
MGEEKPLLVVFRKDRTVPSSSALQMVKYKWTNGWSEWANKGGEIKKYKCEKYCIFSFVWLIKCFVSSVRLVGWQGAKSVLLSVQYLSPNLNMFKKRSPGIDSKQLDSASQCSLAVAGRYVI